MNPLSRRSFLQSTAIGSLALPSLARAAADESSMRMRSRGLFVADCPFEGDRRADDVFPAHPNGLRLSRDRFMILYATRGWRGTDDDRSIIFQIRAGSYDGKVIREGRLARSIDTWDAFGDGKHYVRRHGHPKGFGVPKGAFIDGRPAPHANLFVVKWYLVGRELAAPGVLREEAQTAHLSERTMDVEWCQFRLNESEDDIEMVSPPAALRPVGDNGGPPVRYNQSLGSATALNAACTEWVDLHTRTDHPLRPIVGHRYRFNPLSGRYDWVETGPALFDSTPYAKNAVPGRGDWAPFEASVVLLDGGDWGVCARLVNHPALWLRTGDLFSQKPGRTYTGVAENRPIVTAPVTVFRCADGVIRIFTGDKFASPYGKPRDPLYCWDVDPSRNFAQSNRRTIIDCRATLPSVRAEAYLMADMTKVLPHAGGRTQTIVHRVRTWSVNRALPNKGPALLAHEKDVQGVYRAEMEFDQAYPDAWKFTALG